MRVSQGKASAALTAPSPGSGSVRIGTKLRLKSSGQGGMPRGNSLQHTSSRTEPENVAELKDVIQLLNSPVKAGRSVGNVGPRSSSAMSHHTSGGTISRGESGALSTIVSDGSKRAPQPWAPWGALQRVTGIDAWAEPLQADELEGSSTASSHRPKEPLELDPSTFWTVETQKQVMRMDFVLLAAPAYSNRHLTAARALARALSREASHTLDDLPDPPIPPMGLASSNKQTSCQNIVVLTPIPATALAPTFKESMQHRGQRDDED